MTETVTTPTTETVVTETKVEKPAETTTPETKEIFDEARAMELIEKLRRENRDLAKTQKKLAELEDAEKKRQEAEMTDLQKAQAKLAELETQLQTEKLARMRQEAATKAGLPAVFVDRLKGETPEELEADAKAILEALPKGAEKPKVNPTNPGNAQEGMTLEQQRAAMRGPAIDIWDPVQAQKMGGGVFINSKNKE